MIVRKIGKHGEIVIPKNILELASIKSGDAVKFSLTDNRIVIEKVKTLNEIHNVQKIQEKSMVALLMRGRPFDADLITTLRNEWE